MANVFGTPVYVYSADDSANKSAKGEAVSTRLKDVLKILQPLEKAQSALENAATALNGTGYEKIQKDIQALVQQITTTTQEVVAQLSGGGQQAPAAAPAANPAANPAVPTAGQIAGTEPLPGENA